LTPNRLLRAAVGLALFLPGAACTPKVVVEPPKEPITINMNIKIEHEIRVKVDKDLEDAIATQKDIF
jgi:YnbE-like lipoprotein